MSISLNESTFLLVAAKNYDNPHCYSIDEFHEDLNRIKYIKRLFGKYQETGEIKERLVLNHITVLFNVFNEATVPMLFLKLEGFYSILKPFLILMNRMPEVININEEILFSSDIPMDQKIVEILRKI